VSLQQFFFFVSCHVGKGNREPERPKRKENRSETSFEEMREES
jgi:hypothetical protein